ncbi:MAG: glycosyltransferase family 2 protein [Thermoproteota archaeon]
MVEEIPIIVVNYNGVELLKKYLDSVLQTQYPSNVVVVDSVSKDGSIEYLKEKGVEVIQLDKNYGPAYSRNVAIKKFKTKFMAFLDNDVMVPKDWLNSLVEVINSDDKIAAVQSLYTEWPYSDEPREIPWFSTAAALTRRDVLEKIGGFDEHYFFYWEDAELSWRLYRAGYKVLMVPKSRVYHEGHGTFKKHPSSFTSYLLNRNQLILLLTYYNKKRIITNFLPIFLIRLLQSFYQPNRTAKLKGVFSVFMELGYIRLKRRELKKISVNWDDRFLNYIGKEPFGYPEFRSLIEAVKVKVLNNK